MPRLSRNWIIILGILGLLGLTGWLNSPWSPTVQIGAWQRDFSLRLGLDLQGGTHLVYRADMSEVPSDRHGDALAGVRDVIERRVNAFGVAEPNVQTSEVGEEYRIIVELAGVHDPEQAIAQIGETPQLDFRREVTPEEVSGTLNVDDPSQLTGPLFQRTELTGRHLESARVAFDPTLGTPEVTLQFNSEGAELFAELTEQSVGKRIAIFLDGTPINAPVVQTPITNGQAVISGGFALEEAKELAQRLTAGALPIPIELIGQQTIGPSLGRQSITQSIVAGTLGLVAVVLWMVIFYRGPGIVAAIALVLYTLLFLTLVKLIPITLTLAGIAGFILSIGMAVDANVLIFERFRENLRAGKSVAYAATHGFTEAWGSIRAANVSSLLTAFILYSFGTSVIRGFAVTFALGIALSMFTAITVTRTLLFAILTRSFAQRAAWLGIRPPSSSQ